MLDPANDAAKSDETATNGVAEKEVEREPEEITFTLDEWKAQQGKKEESDFDGGGSYSSSHYHRNHHMAVNLEAPGS